MVQQIFDWLDNPYYLFWAYSIIWFAIFLYIVRVMKKTNQLAADIKVLEKRFEESQGKESS